MFLRPQSDSQPTGQRRGAGVSLAAFAAVGVLGGAAAMGSSNSCDLRGIFCGCQDKAEANAENNRRLSAFQDVLTQFVMELSTDTGGIFSS